MEPASRVEEGKELALVRTFSVYVRVPNGCVTVTRIALSYRYSNQGEFQTWRSQRALPKRRAVMWPRDSHVQKNVRRAAVAGCCELLVSD